MAQTEQVWQYRDDLERLARYLCRHPEDAEDVAHNALMKAASKLDGFRGESTVRTWLHAIASNECRMLRRRAHPASLDQAFDELSERGTADTRELDPEEMALELETRRELLAALERLPEKYRCALILKEGKGLSLEEIAASTDTTVSSVKSTLYRARTELRRMMATDG